jgi:intracellular multiplication protein IcmP
MRSAHGSRAGGSDSAGILLAIIVAGVGFLLWASWRLHHGAISEVAMRLAHWEMQAIGFVSDRYRIADAEVLRANPELIRFDKLVRLYRHIGELFLYPAVGLAALLAASCFARAGARRFSRRLDLEGLMREQVRSFPYVSWTVGRKLGLAGVRAGEPRPADPALRPAEWARLWADGKDGVFDEAKARHELARQLGEPWRGVKDAPASVRCMLAAFALHGEGERADAIELLGLLSSSLPKGKRDGTAGPEKPLAFPKAMVEIANRVLNDAEVGRSALEAMSRHFYTTPGVMTALSEARARAGVLAPAQFAYLKLVDRRLWWALHSLGFEGDGRRAHPHPCPRVEAIGARSHWEAERAAGRALAAPELDSAVVAIRTALQG